MEQEGIFESIFCRNKIVVCFYYYIETRDMKVVVVREDTSGGDADEEQEVIGSGDTGENIEKVLATDQICCMGKRRMREGVREIDKIHTSNDFSFFSF